MQNPDMNWLNNLIRPDLRDMAGYSSARLEAGASVAAVAIDANECPWPPFGANAAALRYNRYPDPQPATLCGRLAALYGVKSEQLLVGRGSDDLIDVLLRAFCQAGVDEIAICPPTYGMYQVSAATQGAKVVKVPLNRNDGWQLDVPAILAACSDKTKLIFIPSPNAPMGHMMRREDILELCTARSQKSLIVVDEAYVEFSSSPEGLTADLAQYSNLAILRTMSKAHALAGERVGCVVCRPEIVRALKKVFAPYPLTQSSIRAAEDALSPNGLIQSREFRRILTAERERMAALLPQSPLVTGVFPSVANFLLLQTTDSGAFMRQLMTFGIRARDRDSEIPNTARITIGTPEENDMVLQALGITAHEKARSPRLFSVARDTKETKIAVTVNLDNPEFLDISTGIGFFDHMLCQIAAHGGFGLTLHCKGDLETGQHHTIEDCALALGAALKGALGDKRGLARFGFSAPLDEALASAVIDLSGRAHAEFSGKLPASEVGGMDSEMVPHFFASLATALGAAIHVSVIGENTHHMIEACFKAVGRALRQALRSDFASGVPSTKGVL